MPQRDTSYLPGLKYQLPGPLRCPLSPPALCSGLAAPSDVLTVPSLPYMLKPTHSAFLSTAWSTHTGVQVSGDFGVCVRMCNVFASICMNVSVLDMHRERPHVIPQGLFQLVLETGCSIGLKPHR